MTAKENEWLGKVNTFFDWAGFFSSNIANLDWAVCCVGECQYLAKYTFIVRSYVTISVLVTQLLSRMSISMCSKGKWSVLERLVPKILRLFREYLKIMQGVISLILLSVLTRPRNTKQRKSSTFNWFLYFKFKFKYDFKHKIKT